MKIMSWLLCETQRLCCFALALILDMMVQRILITRMSKMCYAINAIIILLTAHGDRALCNAK
uniref:Uncharacterized protein n=1 Tax=Octopus bimaculoides TaxID=37653 RepID=A0A0L8IE44_OCTBM